MSYNAVEAYNAKLSDAEMSNEYVCSDRQYVYINDAMNFNYNTGYINFNSVQMVGSDPKKVLDLNSAFMFIPYGAVVNITGANSNTFGNLQTVNNVANTAVLSKNDAMLLAPKGVHHLFSQISVRMGGVTVHQPISYLNYYLNEQLKCMNSDQYRMFSDILGHVWDTADSYTLDKDILEKNNTMVGSSSFSSGLDAGSFSNEGHIRRILKNNVDLTTANMRLGIGAASNSLANGGGKASSAVLQDIFSPALIGVYDGTGAAITPTDAGLYTGSGALGASKLITTLVFQYTAIVPLSILSNFFKEMPSINTLSNFEIKLLTNLSPANTWSVTYPAEAALMAPLSTSSSQAIGETCPFMLSSISSDGTLGCGVKGDQPTITVAPYVGYYNSPPNPFYKW